MRQQSSCAVIIALFIGRSKFFLFLYSQEVWFFQCRCPRCLDPTEFGTMARHGREYAGFFMHLFFCLLKRTSLNIGGGGGDNMSPNIILLATKLVFFNVVEYQVVCQISYSSPLIFQHRKLTYTSLLFAFLLLK